MRKAISATTLVDILRAAGEPTRLRLLLLLGHGDFNVKDLTQLLGQSQPRLSRHLKLLTDAGLIERFQEGSSVFYRFSNRSQNAVLLAPLLNALDKADQDVARDFARAEELRQNKIMAAQAYFQTHAAAWDEIRSYHAPEEAVEAAMLLAIGLQPFETLIDLGTGTGRILELFSDRANTLIGFDVNREMLAHARARLVGGDVRNAQVRQGDIFNLPLDDNVADGVVIHQVLHFLEEPAKALAEAARVLKPSGRLLIADFAPHNIETMRDDYAHRKLGFERGLVENWLRRNGLHNTHYEAISPPKGSEGKLTVSLWAAVKRPDPVTGKSERAQTLSEG